MMQSHTSINAIRNGFFGSSSDSEEIPHIRIRRSISNHKQRHDNLLSQKNQMDSSSDSEMSREWKRRLKIMKREYEDEDMGFEQEKKKEKTRNLSRAMMCHGAKGNLTSCVCALERAKHVQRNLSPKFPSYVKLVTQLLVPGAKEQFLQLPRKFCHEHLPSREVNVIFVNENGEEFSIGYRFSNCRFRVGWKAFCIANRLLKGDTLVLHLIEHCKFKVYIVRACRPTKVDNAGKNTNVDVHVKTDIAKENGDYVVEDSRISMTLKEEEVAYSSEDRQHENNRKSMKSGSTTAPHWRDNLCSGSFRGVSFATSVVKFEDVKNFADFKIYVDGVNLDPELSVSAKLKYYHLCWSQKMFLHDCLVKGVGSKLVTGMISETLNIADAIRSSSLAASPHNLECWDKTLKAFEDLGMSVGFLRARIDKLFKISREYQTMNELMTAKFAEVEEKVRDLSDKVSAMDALQDSIAALKESINSLEAEIDGAKRKNAELSFQFNETAATPWL